METKKKKSRKKYSEEFKREAVKLLETRGERTVADVAASIGVAKNLLHSWRHRYADTAAQIRQERGETPEEELKRLRRENYRLKMEREILKKAAKHSSCQGNISVSFSPGVLKPSVFLGRVLSADAIRSSARCRRFRAVGTTTGLGEAHLSELVETKSSRPRFDPFTASTRSAMAALGFTLSSPLTVSRLGPNVSLV